MDATTTNHHKADNYTYMTAALGKLREILVKHADPSLLEDITDGESPIAKNLVDDSLIDNSITSKELSALDRLCATFNLSDFERNLLLLCAG
ncbi:hypothetical protein PN460_16575, partial [Nodularia sphaerocarpa CS-585A2]|nr:hypothetical protein [Nodularia sphaerocarpa CS-585A2]